MRDATTADLFEARAQRDEGLAQVERAEFTQQVLKALPRMRAEVTTEFCGEDVRLWMSAHGIEAHDPHAWGGLMMGLVRKGEVVQTGGHTQMKDAKSHARETKLYRWANRSAE